VAIEGAKFLSTPPAAEKEISAPLKEVRPAQNCSPSRPIMLAFATLCAVAVNPFHSLCSFQRAGNLANAPDMVHPGALPGIW
jgi:hypothetical protein